MVETRYTFKRKSSTTIISTWEVLTVSLVLNINKETAEAEAEVK